MTPATDALVARAYAALHELEHMTIVLVDELDEPMIYDRAANTIWIRRGVDLHVFAGLTREGIDGLCDGTVIDRDDGDVWAPSPRAVGDVEEVVPHPRPSLRVV